MTITKTSFPSLQNNSNRVALVEGEKTFSYKEVNDRINQFAAGLLRQKSDLREERIAFFMSASLDYVTAMHGVWRAGGIAVPLNVASAVSELDHYLTCADVTRMVAGDEYHDSLRELCHSLNIDLVSVADVLTEESVTVPEISPDRRALMLFTSGTTNKPKGVVSTHRTVEAQITTLVEAWEWSEDDVIPLFLPVHHIHGIINILSCGLWAGATVHLFSKFDIPRISEQIVAGTYNVFMAVPTIYVKLIQYFEGIEEEEVQKICGGFNAMRLNISGSAACPVKLFKQWKELTGQVLLERYGMTETGMLTSNPYSGNRIAGSVGYLLPDVLGKIVDATGKKVVEGKIGILEVSGPNVFPGYWNMPEKTAEEFRSDGYFITGDMAFSDNTGRISIVGREKDLIISGGYNIYPKEIESILDDINGVVESCVIGLPHNDFGEAVVAVIIGDDSIQLSEKLIIDGIKVKLAKYKHPKAIIFAKELPRNTMGKVQKNILRKKLS